MTPITVDIGVLIGAVASIVTALAGVVGLLFRALVKNYDQQIKDISTERDRLRLIVDAQHALTERNALADERALDLLERQRRRE